MESWGTEKSEEEKEGFGIYKKIESGRYDQINMLQSFECIFFYHRYKKIYNNSYNMLDKLS